MATPLRPTACWELCAVVVIWTNAGSGLREYHPFWRSPGSRPRRCLIPSRIHGSRISSTPHLHELQSMWLYAMQALRCMHAYAMAPHVLLLCRAYQHLDAQPMLGPRIPGSRTLVNLMDHGSTHHQIHHSVHQDIWVLMPLTAYCRTLHTPGYSIRVCPTTPWACTVPAACSIWV